MTPAGQRSNKTSNFPGLAPTVSPAVLMVDGLFVRITPKRKCRAPLAGHDIHERKLLGLQQTVDDDSGTTREEATTGAIWVGRLTAGE